MQSISIRTQLTLADWGAYLAAWARRYRARQGRRLIWASLGAAVVVAAVLAAVDFIGDGLQWRELALGALLVYGAFALSRRLAGPLAQPSENGAVLGPCTIELGPEGIRVERQHSSSLLRWALLQEVTATPSHLYLWIDNVSAQIVPIRDLPPGLTTEAVRAAVDAFATAATAATADGTAAADPATEAAATDAAAPMMPPTAAAAAPGPWQELAAIGRLLLLRRTDPARLAGSDSAIATLGIASLAAWVLVDRWRTGAEAEFLSWGASGIAWYVLAAIALAWLLARTCQPRLSLRHTLLLVAGFAPLAVAANAMVVEFAAGTGAAYAYLALFAYGGAYAGRGLQSSTGTGQLRAVAVALVALLGLGRLADGLYISPDVWAAPQADDDDTAYTATWERGEALMFEQPERIEAALATVAVADPAIPEVYFVGFAGYAEERVFAEEIEFAADVVDQRYATAGRSILLVNDRRDLDTLPLATVSGLRRVLAGVAARMNLDQDILFLSLSSHGSDPPTLAVSNGSLPLAELTGEALRDALVASGIRWKVIVISACHAGGFIAPLRDEHTIVLTAARADRSSFGCSDDRDLTDFGEAFYRDGLPGATDLRDAFSRARAEIGRRERADKRTPSDPQAHFGSVLEARLRSIEQSHAAARRAPALAGEVTP